MFRKLLLVDDDPDVRYSFRRIFDSSDIELTTAVSGEEALSLIPCLRPDLVILDMGGLGGLEALRRIRQAAPWLLVVVMTAYRTIQTMIEVMKMGAYDLLPKPFEILKLKETVNKALQAAAEMKRGTRIPQPATPFLSEDPLVGRTEAMQEVFKLIGQLAKSEATVLITGESGTGKELVANAICEHSRRSQRPFRLVNCAAIPEQLLESELFGHEQGAFSGAVSQHLGKFEQCNHGTIFLDEIGDMPPATQTKILRVLQSGTFERVGGNETLQVDVRVIAATNKCLEPSVTSGEFRPELFYRLNVVRLHIPALRDRREDIALLVDHFLKKLACQRQTTPKVVTRAVIKALQRYDWPGNVRELENTLHRAVVLSAGEAIIPSDLPEKILRYKPTTAVHSPDRARLPESQLQQVTAVARQLFVWAKGEHDLGIIEAVYRRLISEALQETGGSQVRAANLLGITRPALRSRMKTYRLFDLPVARRARNWWFRSIAETTAVT